MYREDPGDAAGRIDGWWQALRTARVDLGALADVDAADIPSLDLEIHRPLKYLIRKGTGLGLVLRWDIARYVLMSRGIPCVRTTEKIVEECGLPTSFFQLGHRNKYPKKPETEAKFVEGDSLKKLCALLSNAFRSDYRDALGTNNLHPRDFGCPADGPLAVQRFARFLQTGHKPLSSRAGSVPKPKFFPSADRTACLEHLFRVLKEHDGQPIVELHMRGSPTGLCAVAHEILRHYEEDKKDLRPVLLLPGSRFVPPHEDRNLDFLIENLLAFLQQRSPYKLPPKLSAARVVSSIEEIRKLMARTPGIVVIVGHQVESREYGELRRAIRGEPVLQLLSHIVHPFVGSAASPSNPAFFKQSHVVLLADGEMDILRPYCRESIKFPLPETKHITQVLENIGVPQPDQAHIAKATAGSDKVRSEAVIAAFEQILMLERGANPAPSRQDSATYVESDEKVFTKLVRCIVDPLDLLLLRLVALTDDGIRRATLWRCADAWVDAVAKLPQGKQTPAVRCTLPRDRDECIDQLKATFPMILLEGSDDPENAVGGGDAHPFEYPVLGDSPVLLESMSHSTSEPGVSRAQSLVIRYPEIREAIVNDPRLRTAPTRWAVPLLHQIIAANALRQQMTKLRHAPAATSTTWREYGMAFRCLFHGFQSLPAWTDLETAKSWPQLGTSGGLLPNDALERFRFLYGVVYLRLIERGDFRRLSRHWAADSIKLELCKLIHRAFSSKSRPPRLLEEEPAWGRHPTLRQYLADHYTSAAVSSARTYSLSDWTFVRQGLVNFKKKKVAKKNNDDVATTTKLIDQFLFEMDAAQHGLDETLGQCDEGLGPLASGKFLTNAPWLADERVRIPTASEVETFERDIATLCKDFPVAPKQAAAIWLVRASDAHLRRLRDDSNGSDARWNFAMAAGRMATVAALLRNQLFAADPKNHSPHLPATGCSALARSGLAVLELLATGQPTDNGAGEDHSEFVSFITFQVRRALDWYTLQCSAYSPDVVEMLLLESKFARTVSGSGAVVSLGCLLEAERHLVELRSRPRLRLRLLMERARVFRELAKSAAQNGGAVRHFVELGRLDLGHVKRIVGEVAGKDLGGGREFVAWWNAEAEREALLLTAIENPSDER